MEDRQPSDQVDIDDLKEFLRQLPRDEFEHDALEVLIGEHPEFDTVAEFAAMNCWYSRNHAYRRIAGLKCRIKQVFDTNLN